MCARVPCVFSLLCRVSFASVEGFHFILRNVLRLLGCEEIYVEESCCI